MRKFAFPQGVGDALQRFRRNTNDFGYNYCLLLLVISVVGGVLRVQSTHSLQKVLWFPTHTPYRKHPVSTIAAPIK